MHKLIQILMILLLTLHTSSATTFKPIFGNIDIEVNSSNYNTSIYSFSDISSSSERNMIEYFVNKGYINGYEDQTFKPENKMTRAEFVKLTNKVFNFSQTTTKNFSDVKSSDWFYKDVLIAVKAGYITGSDNLFRPNDFITREEIAVCIYRIKKFKLTTTANFKDYNEISSWAKIAVNSAYANNIISGYSDNTFRPKEYAQRQHVVKMLYNAIS